MSKKLIDLEALKTYDKEIKNHISKSNSGEGEHSVALGKDNIAEANYSIALGESNHALSENAIAMGYSSSAGCKGFYIGAIDFTNKKLYLTDKQVLPVSITEDNASEYIIENYEAPEYAAGDEITLLMYTFYYFCNTIKSIEGNVIELNENLPFTSIRKISSVTVEDYTVSVPAKPEIGNVNISAGGIALGVSCKASGEYAVAEGYGTIAGGKRSHAEGYNTKTGIHAHAEGQGSKASGYASHAEGYNTISSANYSHAEGNKTEATGEYSHAEGSESKSKAQAAHAEGWHTEALGPQSHTEGTFAKTTEKAQSAHAEGSYTIAGSDSQHVQGRYNIGDAENIYAHIVGNGSPAKRSNAHTLDWGGNAWFAGDIFVGENNDKVATEKTIENLVNSAPETLDTLNELAKALGDDPNFATTMANELAKKVNKTDIGTIKAGSGSNSLQAGTGVASGSFSVAVGRTTEASGPHSFAEGWNNDATGDSSHAEGQSTKATASQSHAEGHMTQALGQAAHAEGKETIAKSQMSHAEGYLTQANGAYSHAEGASTIAHGAYSHAEGCQTNARANGAHAEGFGTYIAPGSDYQHVEGRYNKTMNGDYAHIVGNGNVTKDEKGNEVITRSNAHTLKWTGEAWFAGDVFVGENNDKLATERKVQEIANNINKIASTTELGSIIVGTGLSISENGVLSVTGKATETVSIADKAIADELGRNIVNTYPTVEQVNTELNNYATKQYITELNLVNQATLANYSTTAQVETMIEQYIDESIINGAW